MQFTKDTSKVLATIYKIYLERKKLGESKKDAKHFEHDFYKEIKSLSNWQESDISESIHELNKAKFVKMNIIGGFDIQDELIIQMENRFKDGLSEISKYLADLVSGIASNLIF